MLFFISLVPKLYNVSPPILATYSHKQSNKTLFHDIAKVDTIKFVQRYVRGNVINSQPPLLRGCAIQKIWPGVHRSFLWPTGSASHHHSYGGCAHRELCKWHPSGFRVPPRLGHHSADPRWPCPHWITSVAWQPSAWNHTAAGPWEGSEPNTAGWSYACLVKKASTSRRRRAASEQEVNIGGQLDLTLQHTCSLHGSWMGSSWSSMADEEVVGVRLWASGL